jgi:hypothetical protein
MSDGAIWGDADAGLREVVLGPKASEQAAMPNAAVTSGKVTVRMVCISCVRSAARLAWRGGQLMSRGSLVALRRRLSPGLPLSLVPVSDPADQFVTR